MKKNLRIPIICIIFACGFVIKRLKVNNSRRETSHVRIYTHIYNI